MLKDKEVKLKELEMKEKEKQREALILKIKIIVSVILIILGNYMPKIRKNWIVGIRTPHIMSNDEIWDRTHRFGGFVLIFCGILGFIAALLGYFIAAFAILVVSVFIPLIYGEVIYYTHKRKQ